MANKAAHQALHKITLQHYQKHFEQFHSFLKKRYSDPTHAAAFIRLHPKEAAKDLQLLIHGGTLYAGLLHASGLAKHAVAAAIKKNQTSDGKKYITNDPKVLKLMEGRYEAAPTPKLSTGK